MANELENEENDFILIPVGKTVSIHKASGKNLKSIKLYQYPCEKDLDLSNIFFNSILSSNSISDTLSQMITLKDIKVDNSNHLIINQKKLFPHSQNTIVRENKQTLELLARKKLLKNEDKRNMLLIK